MPKVEGSFVYPTELKKGTIIEVMDDYAEGEAGYIEVDPTDGKVRLYKVKEEPLWQNWY